MTWGGSSFTLTGLSTMAPLRAIGVPSQASSVIRGGAIGCSDLDSGAVIASQKTIRMNNSSRPELALVNHHQRVLPNSQGLSAVALEEVAARSSQGFGSPGNIPA